MEARSHLTVGNRSDLDLLIGALLVEIHIDLGHYQDAVTEASRHLEAARSVGSALLEARAGVLLSKAARVNGDVALAASKAADAVRLCQSAHLPLTVTVQALIAAISAGPDIGVDAGFDDALATAPVPSSTRVDASSSRSLYVHTCVRRLSRVACRPCASSTRRPACPPVR